MHSNGMNLGDILKAALNKEVKRVFPNHQQEEEPMNNGDVSLTDVKHKVCDYYGNMGKYVDMSNAEQYRGDRWIVSMRSFEEVTGLRKIGSGHFSNVYHVNDTTVLKIVKKEDTGYARFVALCKKHSDNPYLPRIKYSGVWGGKTVYLLERLREAGYAESNLTQEFINVVNQRHIPRFYTITDANLLAVRDLLQGERMVTDLHSQNVMYRGDQPVITDPCAEFN
jgi:hypothetical protein